MTRFHGALLMACLACGCNSARMIDSAAVEARFGGTLENVSCRGEQATTYVACTFDTTPRFLALLTARTQAGMGGMALKRELRLGAIKVQEDLGLSNQFGYGCRPHDVSVNPDELVTISPRVILVAADRSVTDFEALIGQKRTCILYLGKLN